jgi:hypothetical protein
MWKVIKRMQPAGYGGGEPYIIWKEGAERTQTI